MLSLQLSSLMHTPMEKKKKLFRSLVSQWSRSSLTAMFLHFPCSSLSRPRIFSAKTKSPTSLNSFTSSYASQTDVSLPLMHVLLLEVHQAIWSWVHDNTCVSRQQNYLLGAVKAHSIIPSSLAFQFYSLSIFVPYFRRPSDHWQSHSLQWCGASSMSCFAMG